jgi:hypothetical protein
MKRYVSSVLAGSLLMATLPLASVQAAPATSASTSDWAPGVTVRSTSGSLAKIDAAADKVVASDVSGRHFVRIDGRHKVVIQTATGTVVANSGEFLVDSKDATKLHVFQGDAHVEGRTSKVEVVTQVKQIKPTQVALDGGDIRARNRDDDEFRKGTNRNKAVNRIKPKPPVSRPIQRPVTPPTTNTPPTVITQPPVVNTPPPVVNTPPPVVNTPPPAVGGGGAWWPWVLGGLALGGGIFALIDGNNNDPVPPASP